MEKCEKAFSMLEALAVMAVLSLILVPFSEATGTWTVDLAGLTTDVTTVGTAILAVVVIIFGFKTVRRMVR